MKVYCQILEFRDNFNAIQLIIGKLLKYLDFRRSKKTHWKSRKQCCVVLKLIALKLQKISDFLIGVQQMEKCVSTLKDSTSDKV